MSMHFVYGFLVTTLLLQMYLSGQFPSGGHPLKLLSALVQTGLPRLALARQSA